jgi:hypothetical protein
MASSQEDSSDSYERVVPETVDEEDNSEAEEPVLDLVTGSDGVLLHQDSLPADESDMDPSDDEGGAADPQDLVDTDVPGTHDGVGELLFGFSKCQVILLQKAGGKAVICGHPAISCSWATHRAKREDPDSWAPRGHYIGVYNANKTVVDGLKDTYTGYKDHQQFRDDNLEQMKACVSSSTQKEASEAVY